MSTEYAVYSYIHANCWTVKYPCACTAQYDSTKIACDILCRPRTNVAFGKPGTVSIVWPGSRFRMYGEM